MPKKIKVLIAEDHHIVREGLKILISSDPQIKIAGEAENGEKALTMAKRLRPDVVLIDLTMPRGNGLQATRDICQQVPHSKVLVLSACHDPRAVRRAIEVGASGYLTEGSAANELLTAIREVQRGNRYFSPGIAARLNRQLRSRFLGGRPGPKPPPVTPRESRILLLIARGLPNRSIAAELSLSVKTVEKCRREIMKKLDLHDIGGLTRYALSKRQLATRAAVAPAPVVRYQTAQFPRHCAPDPAAQKEAASL